MFSSATGSSIHSVSLLNTSTSSLRGLQTTTRGTSGLANRSQRAEQVLEETAHHVVKALNSPVPVQVQEALRSDLSAVSVKLHPCGWAWLVCGKKVLLWRYTPSQAVARCFQLGLPSPSHSSGWNANLVTVCGQLSDTHVSLLAASPDGHLHYWSTVLRERSAPSVDGTVDVGTDQVIIATPILQGNGVVLFTSEGQLFLLPLPSESRAMLCPRQLHGPQGVLSGFGRKVSSLLFGSSGVEQATKGRGIAVGEGERGSCVFVLTNTVLQKWLVADGRDQMVYEASLEPIIVATVAQNNWLKEQQVSAASITVWTIDVKLAKDYVAILFAVTVEGSSMAEYGLALFNAHHDSTPLRTDHLIRIGHKIPYQIGREDSLYTLALQCTASSQSLTVYDTNTLLLSIATEEQVVTDVVHFPTSTSILGAGEMDNNVVLFTTGHGVVSIHVTSPLPSPSPPSPHSSSITQSQATMDSSLLMTSAVSRGHAQPVLPAEAISQAVDQLKAAFLDYLEGNFSEAGISLHTLFPGGSYSQTLTDSLGDVAVKRLSEMVLDDQPAKDPRWGDSRESLSGGSLIILYQLENKLTAHARLMQFLVDTGVLEKLSCVTERGHSMRTTNLLCEHTEKIAAATALRKNHNPLVDQAMKVCVSQWTSSASQRPGLTHQDVFYTEVTQLDSIFPSLVSTMDSQLQSVSVPKDRLQVVLAVCSAAEAMLRDAIQYRQTKSSLYSSHLTPDPSFLPWTASPGSSGVRNSLRQLLDVLYDAGLRDADTPQESVELWRVAVGLSDVLLGGYLDQIHSIQQNPSHTTELAQVRKHFESAREKFLSPLLEHGQYEQAIELGEKYQDFQLLVRLCESAGDRERMKSYVARFAEHGFAEFLFKEYLDQGKLQELLAYSEDLPQQLAKFLKPHDHISWLHHMALKDYTMAHATLYSLAQKEDKYLSKKKTQLSLSKLALLASGSDNGNGDMSEINRQLSIIEYQQNIPDSVLVDLGMDMETMPPLPPADIVELYVSEENVHATELDFLCALELLQIAYKDKTCEEFIDLRTYIWSQAALRDDWSQMSTDNPLDQLPATLFFRIIQTAFNKDFDLESLLPTVDSLLSSPTLLDAGMAQSPQFRFLVRAGFEQLQRIQDSGPPP